MAVEPILWEENPLGTLGQDYDQATIHLAWGINNTTRERTLLFATVELLPLEVPPPYAEGEHNLLLRGSRGHRLFTRHIVTSAGEALAWYRSCALVLPRTPLMAIHRPAAMAITQRARQHSWLATLTELPDA
ncbi:MAG: hypothetical protein JNJ46_05555 [Myxococcales bacterium]|nr:hypothetical protein [Myxococcales bacterium]